VQGFNTIRLDVLEAVNLFAGPIPTASLHLQLASMKLPEISQRFIEHAAGGSPVEIEVPVTVVKLTAGFTLAGWTPHVMAQALSGEQTFTCWGVLRDKRSGRAHQARAIIGGYQGDHALRPDGGEAAGVLLGFLQPGRPDWRLRAGHASRPVRVHR
jgi:hypothetical protein